MKIKKVEIQAFRAYDEVKDCTFDFQTNEGKYADFVSIYAPNGFGKTSFYDAVEWGVTNNIYRFTRNISLNKSYAHDEKQLKYETEKNKSPQYILRNKNSPPERESFVKLHLSNPDDEKLRVIPKAPRVDSTDYSFDENLTENIHFRNVILSQENIDAFLKEDQPDIRYQKFVNFFGDKELDRCYSNVLHLIRVNDNKIIALEKQRQQLESEIPQNTDDEILAKINVKINELIQKGEELYIITPSFDELKFLEFSTLIIDKKILLNAKIKENQDRIDYFKTKELELEEYIHVKTVVSSQQKFFDDLLIVKRNFELSNKLKNELLNKKKIIEDTINEKLLIEDLIKSLPKFLETANLIKNQREDILSYNVNLNSTNTTLTFLQSELAKLRSTYDNLLKIIYESELKFNELDSLEEADRKSSSNLKTITELINNITLEISNTDKHIQELHIKERSVKFEINQIRNDEFSNSLINDERLSDFIKVVIENRQKLKKLNTDLQFQNVEKKKYNSLNDDLKKLVLFASSILKDNDEHACPLCGQEYNSYDELINKINNNALIDENLKNITSKILAIEETITLLNSETDIMLKNILAIKEAELKEIQSRITEYESLKNKLNSNLELYKRNLLSIESLRKELFVKFEGGDFISYKTYLENKLQKSRDDLISINTQIDLKLTAEAQLVSTINSTNKSIALFEANIKSLELTREFVKVNSFLIRNNLHDVSIGESLDLFLERKQKEIDALVNEENSSKTILRDTTIALSAYNEAVVDSEMDFYQSTIIRLKSEMSVFIGFIVEIYGIDFMESDKTTLATLIKESTERLKNSNDSNLLLLSDYNKIDEYKDSVIPLLKLRLLKNSIDEVKNKILFQKEKVSKHLNLEKDKLSSFINLQVESFFYEELINKLYQKIDPHPEYRKIVFKCDFSNDKPRLNVFVYGNDQVHLIPNLYFSTAQMNILSLSIFLAKALNTTDSSGNSIDCIFIDDPIQAMDSINILSTIDLIRSIVVNLKKQVVLSTHDENFHNLLKRKMPPALFNSKYIELETFGKVKPD